MFKPGDKFILYTKYGGVVKGEVKEILEITGIDTTNKVNYVYTKLLTTNDIIYSMDGTDGKLYKIKSEMTEEQVEKVKNVIKELKDSRERMRIKSQDFLQELIDKHKPRV